MEARSELTMEESRGIWLGFLVMLHLQQKKWKDFGNKRTIYILCGWKKINSKTVLRLNRTQASPSITHIDPCATDVLSSKFSFCKNLVKFKRKD